MRFALLLAALTLAGGSCARPAGHAQPPARVTCSRTRPVSACSRRRLAAAANADQATQCRTYREHVAYLQKSRSTFATCQSGARRERSVAEMDSELVNYRALIANRCGGR